MSWFDRGGKIRYPVTKSCKKSESSISFISPMLAGISFLTLIICLGGTMKKNMKFKTAMLFTLVLILGLSGCEKNSTSVKTLVFADLSWDSVQVHNRIMGFIIENGLEGYKAEYMSGDTIPTVNGLSNGDIHVMMESWHSNYQEAYDKYTASGDIVNVGKNMPNAPQGWWVPRYLVEGPDALAPNLRSIKDLPRYVHLFKDPEDPNKGLIYGGMSGWGQLEISEKMVTENGLDKMFNLGAAGSDAALAGTMAGAYKKKEPWCGYYWEPSAIMGKLDMVLLEGSEFPPAKVDILVNKSLLEEAPDIVEILKKYSTTVATNNEFLAEMSNNDWSTEEAAKWFLKNRQEVWMPWVSKETADKVRAAL